MLRVTSAMDATFIAKRALPVETDVNARIAQLADQMSAMLGQGFVILPHITLSSAAATELKSAIAGSKAALGGDVLAANSCQLHRGVLTPSDSCMWPRYRRAT